MSKYCKIIIFTLVALIASAPADVCARKKDRHSSKTAFVTTPEPDALPARAPKLAVISVPAEARIGSALDNVAREGIDVSHYQGTIDWQAVASNQNIGYAYMKASEGESLGDDTYRYNIVNAKKAGLKVGSYHFYRPNANMDMQFQNLTANIRAEEQDIAIIIDVETRGKKSHDAFIADLRRFLQRVENHYKSKPLVYTFMNFYNKYLSGELNDYPLMIAKYHEEEPVLNDGRTYNVWQYTSKGEIDGVRGFVDRSMVMPDFSISDISFR